MSKPHKPKPSSGAPITRRTLLRAAAVGAAGAAGTALAYGAGWFSDPAPTSPAPAVAGSGGMTQRTHPTSGDRVSLLGFGCMRFPLLPETTPGGQRVDEAAAFALVDHALANGVTYFDTAYRYHGGTSELVIGKALKRHPRESFLLADKMPGGSLTTLEQAKTIFATQLQRCQVDYFDYYLLHGVSDLAGYTQVYETNGVLDYLLEQKAAGRIRNLGWSFHGDRAMLTHLITRLDLWDFGMVQLNYHDLMHEYAPQPFVARNLKDAPADPRWVLEQLAPTGLPLVIMEPLLGGRLARLNQRAVSILQAERPDASAASWGFRYAAQLPNVFCVLSGMTYMEHLQDNIRTYSPFVPLSERETAVLRRALSAFVSQDAIPCTACGYCMPCPYGVDIPAVFTHYNACVDERRVPKGAQDAEYAKARRAFLVGHDRSVPDLRQASHCTGCGLCVTPCPQRIDIPERMAFLGRFVEKLRNGV